MTATLINVICQFNSKDGEISTMDEVGFKDFLKQKKKADKTIKAYVSHVKKFESYLAEYREGRRLDQAGSKDIRGFANWSVGELKSVAPFLAAILKYYEHLSNKEKMCRAIRKELSRSKPPRYVLVRITLNDFEECMKKAEKKGISNRDRALLNLLWSRMRSNEILHLKILDIDFEKYCIKSRITGTKYYATDKAWDALEKYIPIEERGKEKSLFSMRMRGLNHITRKYFKELGQTPLKLKKSCELEIAKAGEKSMFRVVDEGAPETKVGASKKRIQELDFPTKVLEKLPLEVRDTVQGVIFNYRIGFPDFCFWGMRKALIDAIKIRFRRDGKEKRLYDRDGKAHSLPKWIEYAKQERYFSASLAKYLNKEVKVFGDTASHDYMVDFQKGEVPPIFKHLRLALDRMYYQDPQN